MEYDFSDWLNEIIEKHDSESQKDYYNRLIAMKIRLDFQLAEPRCVGCEFYHDKKCTNFHQDLTDGQQYEPHNCKAYTDRIPF